MEGGQPGDDGEPAMKIRIGAMALMALLAIGDAGTIASAAKVISVPQRTRLDPQRTQLTSARSQRAYRQDRGGYGPYDSSAYDHSPYDHSRYDHGPYDRPHGGGW